MMYPIETIKIELNEATVLDRSPQNKTMLNDLPNEMITMIIADYVAMINHSERFNRWSLNFTALFHVNNRIRSIAIKYFAADHIAFAKILDHAIAVGNVALINTLLESNPDIARLEKANDAHHSFIMEIIYSERICDNAKRELLEKFMALNANIPIRELLLNNQYGFIRKFENEAEAYRLYMIGNMVDYAIKHKLEFELPTSVDLRSPSPIKLDRDYFFVALKLQKAGKISDAAAHLGQNAFRETTTKVRGNNDNGYYNEYYVVKFTWHDFIIARIANYYQQLNKFKKAWRVYESLNSEKNSIDYTNSNGLRKRYRCVNYRNEVAQLFIAWVNSSDAHNAAPEYADLFTQVKALPLNKLMSRTAEQLVEALDKHEKRKKDYESFDNDIHYAHQLESRTHYKKLRYKSQSGDRAKATILKEFKNLINAINTIDALNAFTANLKNDERFNILQTGQDITTLVLNSIFHIKETTSEKSLLKMIEIKRSALLLMSENKDTQTTPSQESSEDSQTKRLLASTAD